MTDYDSLDYFTDQSLISNPYPYFDYLRDRCPVTREPHHGVVTVTGWEEANAIFKDTESFSACIAVAGPFTPLPFVAEGDDIRAQIAQHRPEIPMYDHMVTMDPPEHTQARSILSRLLTPKRLKENEDFMWRLADRHIDEFIADDKCEFLAAYARPFALLVIADLLGVPEEDHDEFREAFGAARPGTRVGAIDHEPMSTNPLEWADEKFIAYIEDRRRQPRDDVLTALATAKYPDESIPEAIDVVRTATFLFGAGQETTAKLLSAALQVLGEQPELQQQLRNDRSRIPAFVEECLRAESPVKGVFRLVQKSTRIGDIDLPAGTMIMVSPGAVNRDPRRFDDPNEFQAARKNVREHMAFSRGVHSCPGAPLARIEGRVSLERILDRLGDITIDAEKHGPAANRHYSYEPTFILRGLTDLHIQFTPIR
jgi:cytochrome P450